MSIWCALCTSNLTDQQDKKPLPVEVRVSPWTNHIPQWEDGLTVDFYCQGCYRVLREAMKPVIKKLAAEGKYGWQRQKEFEKRHKKL